MGWGGGGCGVHSEIPAQPGSGHRLRGTGVSLVCRRDWGQEKKGTTEDEIVGWHHRLNGREFE